MGRYTPPIKTGDNMDIENKDTEITYVGFGSGDEINSGWHDIYTVPVGKNYILFGAWCNNWNSAWKVDLIGICNESDDDYLIYSNPEALSKVKAIIEYPIRLKPGWKVRFYQTGTSARGSVGIYGYEY